MAKAVQTPKEWISRQTKCNQCCYHNTKKCESVPCFPLEHSADNQIDVYYVE